jgi:hypothetical protein
MGLSKNDSDTLWQAVQDRKYLPASPPLLHTSYHFPQYVATQSNKMVY